MDKTLTTIEDYYIVFTNSKQNHWLIKRLKKGFQHVLAVKKSAGGQFWVIVNPLMPYTLVDIVPVSEYPHVNTLLDDPYGSTVVPVSAFIKAQDRHTLCIINCVEIVKSLIGVRAFWVWTPHQLYKHLKKGGKREQRKNYSRIDKDIT